MLGRRPDVDNHAELIGLQRLESGELRLQQAEGTVVLARRHPLFQELAAAVQVHEDRDLGPQHVAVGGGAAKQVTTPGRPASI